MAFVKKTWKDRIVQYANRRLLTKSGGEVEQVTVTRDEGTISEAGDQFNASNMNDLENRVNDGFDGLNAAELPIQSGSSTNTKDYIDSIVESGSNTNGYYIKYADGTMICTKVQIRGLQASDWNAWGSCYDSEIQDLGSWANTFYSAPVVNVNVSGAGAWIENVWDMSTTACGKLRLVRPSIPGGGITINFQIIGVGRWKA